MQIFVFEFITGGGLLSLPGAPKPCGSLLAEGRAMAAAVSADFLALQDVELLTTRDSRLSPLHPDAADVTIVRSVADERTAFDALAKTADWTLVIAPETAGALLQRAEQALSAGGRLLSPLPDLVRLASDKQQTADWLLAHGIRAPRGCVVDRTNPPPVDFPFPAVLKPNGGCGSQDIRLVSNVGRVSNPSAAGLVSNPSLRLRLEPLIPGLAASVSILCGPAGHVALPACEQRLSADGRFRYLGGLTPLPAALDRRARQLALAAIHTLPAPIGYIGVDLVLGDEARGAADFVIEINARLTTSYVGLRAACRENLAAAMLAIATGSLATLSFHPQPLEFDADGMIHATAANLQAPTELARWQP
ncbi:MAG TPA: ATP-grasp domain-containing protein [Pirellulaceae bacterium]|nr:ATP-grasp domain-containing protein [Pirellulaceae bacterium]